MKEISLSRILRWTLASFIVSFAVALIFNVGIASAETGTITVLNETDLINFALGVGASNHVSNWSVFLFDNTDYNKVSRYRIVWESVGTSPFPDNFNATTFTIISGGTGSGYASYSKSDRNQTWTFSDNTLITSNVFVIQYADQIYSNWDAGAVWKDTGSSTPTLANPMGVTNLETPAMTNRFIYGLNGGASINHYEILFAGSQTSINYNVTYPSGNYLAKIDKSQSLLNTRVNFHSSTINQSTEFSFNKVNFSILNPHLDGLYINVTVSGGGYNDVLINSSGVAPGPTPTPIGGGGSSSGQIYFDYTNSTPGAVYGINASISNANFSSFNTYYIDVFDPTGTEIFGFPASFGTQNYSTGRFYYFNKFGTYTANLSFCSFINPLCPSVFSPTRLDTASLTINQIALSYNVSTDKPNYQQGDTIYINATNPGLTKTYVTATGTTGIITELAWNAQVDPNSVRVIVGTVPNTLPLGTYFVSLAGSQGYNPILAQARFNITANTPDNVLGLGWNDYLYTVGATGILTYKSNMNLSTVTIYRQGNSNEGLVSVKSFSAPAGNITGNYSQIFNSPGNWYAYIVDSVNNSSFKWANTSVLNPNPTDPNAQNLCKSKESYVCWDKHEYTQGDAYIINYKLVVPSIITYFPTINIYDPDDKVVRTVKLNYSIWNNTITGAISGKFGITSKTGIWFVRAEKINQVTAENNGEIANSATSVIGRNASTVPTSTVPSGSSAVSSFGSNLISFMAMPAFWGLFIFIGAIFWVSRSRGASGDLGIVAFILANLEAVIGLWSPFTWYILIVSWVIAGIYFTVGRKAVTQN